MLNRMWLLCRPRLLTQVRSLASVAQKTTIDTSPVLVKQIQKEDETGMLHVHWKDSTVINRYPYIYLRDNCQCPKCLDIHSLQRNLDTVADIDVDIRPTDVKVSQSGEKICIVWPDEHISEFDSTWLQIKRLPEKEEPQDKIKLNGEGVEFWNRKTLHDKIPRFDWHRIITDNSHLFDWLYALHSVGLALVMGIPRHKDPISCVRLAERVGYIKYTHYGISFDVHAKFDANNLAYTTGDLPLHCDLPQCLYYPGVQFLHCVEQAPTEGGSNIFVDGFHIAQEVKERDAKLFSLLCNTPLPYIDVGKDVFGDFHMANRRPVIELDHLGNIKCFTYNNHIRAYFMDDPPEVVQEVYKACLLLGQMMRDPANMIEYKLSAGEMVTFNNSRVLHGRRSYEVIGTGNRHLQGIYVDWDLVNSRLRALGRSLGRPFNC